MVRDLFLFFSPILMLLVGKGLGGLEGLVGKGLGDLVQWMVVAEYMGAGRRTGDDTGYKMIAQRLGKAG